MDLIRTIREKNESSKQSRIRKQAEELITIVDFDDQLYIGFEEIPLVLIEKDWTVDQIIDKLKTLRTTFVNGRMKNE